MRILGLDVGDKNIGVAVSDGLGIAAHGLSTISRNDYRQALQNLIEEYDVQSVVVGVPRMMNGSMGIQGEKVLRFVEELRDALSLPVILWDERLSTVAAERTLLEANVRRKKRKGLRDKVAAVVILQNYLDSVSA